VPILLFIAGLIFIFGQDHPCGRWEERNAFYLEKGHNVTSSFDDEKDSQKKEKGLENAIHQGQDEDNSTVENTVPTLATYFRILISPVTWLPTLAYMTTFGLELAIDSNLGNVLFSLFNPKRRGFTQTKAGYYTSIL
jgi:NNP family nitrate/nitrite transporter-like MFS transporter